MIKLKFPGHGLSSSQPIRVPMLLAGAGITLLLILFSLFVGGILLLGGALLLVMRHGRRVLSPASVRPANPSVTRSKVLEGEFVVLSQRSLSPRG